MILKEQFEKLKNKESVRETLSAIRSEIKEDKKKEELLQQPGLQEVLVGFLEDEDAKTRKNAALLIGDLKLQEADEALLTAYQKEKTLFVRSSYLAALGKLDASEYLEYFKERLEELKQQPVAEEEKKHRNEEIRE